MHKSCNAQQSMESKAFLIYVCVPLLAFPLVNCNVAYLQHDL